MALLFLLGLAWTVFNRPADGSTTEGTIPAPQIGFTAPAFTLPDLSGTEVDLADLQGRVVVLNFWASWCPPCRAEMPAFEQAFRRYEDQGLVVLTVNAAYQDPLDDMQAFLEPLAPSFPILRDTNGAVNRLYAITSLPTTFFIGRDGTIRDLVIGGPLTEAGLAGRIESLLQELP
jgi:peroxiredoxin